VTYINYFCIFYLPRRLRILSQINSQTISCVDLIPAHKLQLLILSAVNLDHYKGLYARRQAQFLKLFRCAEVPVCSENNYITNASSKHMFQGFLLESCEYALVKMLCDIIDIAKHRQK